MKFRWDKKYLYWGLTAFVVLVGCIGVIYFLFNGSILKYNVKKIIKILMPIIDGLIIAYLLAPLWGIIRRCMCCMLNVCRFNEVDGVRLGA